MGKAVSGRALGGGIRGLGNIVKSFDKGGDENKSCRWRPSSLHGNRGISDRATCIQTLIEIKVV
jgi:hypothetical protein